MAKVTPWLGQSEKLRKKPFKNPKPPPPPPHRLIKRLKLMSEMMLLVTQSVNPHCTQLGQDELLRSLRDLLKKIAPVGNLLKDGEVVRRHMHKMLIGRAYMIC